MSDELCPRTRVASFPMNEATPLLRKVREMITFTKVLCINDKFSDIDMLIIRAVSVHGIQYLGIVRLRSTAANYADITRGPSAIFDIIGPDVRNCLGTIHERISVGIKFIVRLYDGEWLMLGREPFTCILIIHCEFIRV